MHIINKFKPFNPANKYIKRALKELGKNGQVCFSLTSEEAELLNVIKSTSYVLRVIY